MLIKIQILYIVHFFLLHNEIDILIYVNSPARASCKIFSSLMKPRE